MSFFDKPIEVKKLVPHKGEKAIPYPEDILDKDEYIIFITNGSPFCYRLGQIYSVCITSHGRIIGCAYKSKDWMIFDEKSMDHPHLRWPPPCFLNRGWQLVIDKMHNIVPSELSLGGVDGGYGRDARLHLYFTPFNVLIELYASFFPDSKITSSNNDADKYFEMINVQHNISADQMSQVSDILNKMNDQLTKSSSSETSSKKEFNKARKELKRLINKSRGSLKKLTEDKTKRKKHRGGRRNYRRRTRRIHSY